MSQRRLRARTRPFVGIGQVPRSQLERWFSLSGRPPQFDLARSGATGLTVRQLLRLAAPQDVETYLEMALDYGPGVGSDRLAAAIAATVGCPPEDVVVTHGAIEALLLVCAASLTGRTAVAVATPAYEGLFRAVEAAGGVAESVPVWGPGASALDLARMFELDLTRYGAVVVNSPTTPPDSPPEPPTWPRWPIDAPRRAPRSSSIRSPLARSIRVHHQRCSSHASLRRLSRSATSASRSAWVDSAWGGAPCPNSRAGTASQSCTRRHKSGQLGAEPTPGRHRPGEPVGLIGCPHGSHKPRSLVFPRGRVGTSGRMEQAH